MRYLDCPKDSFPWKIRQLLEHGSTAIDPAVAQTPPHASLEKFSVLPLPFCGWAYVEKEKGFLACLPPLLLKRQESLVAKSGVSCYPAAHGFHRSHIKQCVRYPELVTFNGTNWNFGKFVPHERPQRGGFLPIFWDVPRADTHAVEDIGAVVDWLTERCDFRAGAKSSLAVLHNRNDMAGLCASNWVSGSQDSIVSRGGHHLCRHDSPYSHPCPNQSWFPNRRPQKVLSSSTWGRTNGATWGSVCSSDGCYYQG